MGPCRFCGKVLASKLWEHEKSHKDAFKKGKAYLCEKCKVGFRDYDVLVEHERRFCQLLHPTPPKVHHPTPPEGDDGDYLDDFLDDFHHEMHEEAPSESSDSPEMGQELDEGDLFDWLSAQPDLPLPKGDGNQIFKTREDLLMYLIFEGSGHNKISFVKRQLLLMLLHHPSFDLSKLSKLAKEFDNIRERLNQQSLKQRKSQMVPRLAPKESSSQAVDDQAILDELGQVKVTHEYFSIEGTLKTFLQDPKFLVTCQAKPQVKEVVENFMDSPLFNNPNEISQLLSASWRGVTYEIFDDCEIVPSEESGVPWYARIMEFGYKNDERNLPGLFAKVHYYERPPGFHRYYLDCDNLQEIWIGSIVKKITVGPNEF